jgi:hypothetical protein
VSFVKTTDILTAMKAGLESLALPGTTTGEKLFERVDYHENKRLRQALQDLVIIKQRVAILVPGGDQYDNVREGRSIRSARTSTFDLLLADRAWTKGGHEAVFGGPNNVGVLTMKDLVVDYFVANPQLGLPWVTLTPIEGAQIEIADDQVKDSPGRECYVLHYGTPAGEQTITPTARWIDPPRIS